MTWRLSIICYMQQRRGVYHFILSADTVEYIQSVTQTLVKNAENVQSLAEASDVGYRGLREAAADIQEIA
ncbi:hypothetical protein ACYULU_03910 [Breznakiellaceae bacterium SP9]